MAGVLTPELIDELDKLNRALNSRFSQPEFIAGCQVLGTADINEYAVNNGWIEALCGHHNRQRVRWKSAEVVGTTSYIDVVYFPDRRIFETWGIGGATVPTIPGSSGAWPYDNIFTVSTTNAAADYSTIAAAITAASAGDAILLDAETFTESITINKDIHILGTGAVITSASATTVTISSRCRVIGLEVLNTASGASARCVQVSSTVSPPVLEFCRLLKTSGSPTIGAALYISGAGGVELRECQINGSAGTSGYGIYADLSTSCVMRGGYLSGSTLAAYSTDAASTLILHNLPDVTGSITFGNVSGSSVGFYTTSANIYALRNSGIVGGVWLLAADDLRLWFPTIATAITAASAGDTILLYPGTYSGAVTLSKAITLAGLDPLTTIITDSTNSAPTIDVTADGARLQNLTITHTGAGTTAGVLATDNASLVVENCIITKSSGAASTSYGFWMYGAGSARLTNTRIANTAGTTKRGIQITNGAGTITVEGGQIGGDTADLYSDQSGAIITLNDPILTNASKDWVGTVRGAAFDTYGRRLRVKPAGINGGRITLTSATPVLTSDVTAATSVYFTPYNGSKIEVYNGSFWMEAPFAELSLSLSGFTTNKVSDLWIYDNAGTLALERTEWTNLTTRATALALQDGRYCKSGTLTRLYVGSFRTNATSQCDHTAKRAGLWNMYNQVKTIIKANDTTNHTYTTSSYRNWENNSDLVVDVLLGINTNILVSGWGAALAAGGNNAILAIGREGAQQDYVFFGAVTAYTSGSSVLAFNELGSIQFSIMEYGFASGTPTYDQAKITIEYLG
jgi:hypothetical protein